VATRREVNSETFNPRFIYFDLFRLEILFRDIASDLIAKIQVDLQIRRLPELQHNLVNN
jgi:hypothetical protein